MEDKLVTLMGNKDNLEEKILAETFTYFVDETDLNLSSGPVIGAWLVPYLPHHAGYDAACIKNVDQNGIDLVFVQLTVGKTHSLNEKHLMPLVYQILSFGLVVSRVELFFVLRKEDKQFSVPPSKITESDELRRCKYVGFRSMVVTSF